MTTASNRLTLSDEQLSIIERAARAIADAADTTLEIEDMVLQGVPVSVIRETMERVWRQMGYKERSIQYMLPACLKDNSMRELGLVPKGTGRRAAAKFCSGNGNGQTTLLISRDSDDPIGEDDQNDEPEIPAKEYRPPQTRIIERDGIECVEIPTVLARPAGLKAGDWIRLEVLGSGLARRFRIHRASPGDKDAVQLSAKENGRSPHLIPLPSSITKQLSIIAGQGGITWKVIEIEGCYEKDALLLESDAE